MRCPHCASSRVAPPLCRTCGKRLDEPVQQQTMPGLEPTAVPEAEADVGQSLPGLEPTQRAPAPDVAPASVPGLETTHGSQPAVTAERMPGLITNEEALGDTSISDQAVPETPNCPRCKIDVAEARFCPRCGFAVVSLHVEEDDAPELVCLECGVPNPATRTRCMTCGNRM